MIIDSQVLLQKLKGVFEERGITAIYRRYSGTSKQKDSEQRIINVDAFQEFPIRSLSGKSKKWTMTATGPALMAVSHGAWIFREQDVVAAGLAVSDLTPKKDRIKYGTDEYIIEDIRHVSPFIRCQAKGG